MHLQFFGRGGGGSPVAHPIARIERLVVEEVEGEALVYDQDRHEIHRLNPTLLAVWRLSDGTRAAHQISPLASSLLDVVVDDQAVRLAWTLLSDSRLLREPLTQEMRVERKSRRSLLKGVLVSGAAALPVIISTSAPKAAAAASQGCSGKTQSCRTTSDCCPGFDCYDATIVSDGFCDS